MNITITNKIGKPAKKYLEDYKTRFPQFSFTSDKIYNGIAVEVDDDDAEDFYEALDSAGFDYDSDSEPVVDVPKKSNVPRWPKNKPKLAKSKPTLPRPAPKLPRYPKYL